MKYTVKKGVGHIKNNYGDIKVADTINYYISKKNYKDNYKKAIQAMKKGLFDKAEKLLIEFRDEVDDIRDSELLLTICFFSNKRVDRLNNEVVDKYFNKINNNFQNNYLGLVILGLLHIDYYNATYTKAPKGLSLEDVLINIEKLSNMTDSQYMLHSIKFSQIAKQKLKIE